MKLSDLMMSPDELNRFLTPEDGREHLQHEINIRENHDCKAEACDTCLEVMELQEQLKNS